MDSEETETPDDAGERMAVPPAVRDLYTVNDQAKEVAQELEKVQQRLATLQQADPASTATAEEIQRVGQDILGLQRQQYAIGKRQLRFKRIPGVTEFEDIGQYHAEDESQDFTTQVLQASKYDALSYTENATDPGKETTEAGIKKATRDSDDPATMDSNDPNTHATLDDVAALMDNNAFQPSDYRAALNMARIKSRLNPRIPGQSYKVKPNLFWQVTGAAHILQQRRAASKKRLNQLAQLLEQEHPYAVEASRDDLDHDIILADEVGIGKTDTAAAYRLIVSVRTQAGKQGKPARTCKEQKQLEKDESNAYQSGIWEPRGVRIGRRRRCEA